MRAPNSPCGFRWLEDNDDARDSLVTSLQLDGHDVRAARTGGEGMQIVLQEAPEIVLIDIGLPDLDGYQVARILRAKFASTIRLVALTGYGQPEDRKRSQDAGFDVHLIKPVAGEDLIRLFAAP